MSLEEIIGNNVAIANQHNAQSVDEAMPDDDAASNHKYVKRALQFMLKGVLM
ncbi:MAG: hypothetical protein Q9160_008838 [Pyrenula sp. 1 TL-2023]